MITVEAIMGILEEYDLNSQAYCGHSPKNVSEAIVEYVDTVDETSLHARIMARLKFLREAVAGISELLDSIHVTETVFCKEEIAMMNAHKKEIFILESILKG